MEQPPRTADPRKAAQIAYWNNQTAANWTAFQERIDSIFEPITALAIHTASPLPGERVLDIGCGCGSTVLELARRVGPRGHVLGVDISVPMSARAQQRIAAAQVSGAEIIVADAATFDFAPGDRDLLFSRFGVMFFAEPLPALVNLRKATRAGGRLEWIVWRAIDENPFFAAPLRAALPLLPPAPAVDPLAPGPFAFADTDRVKDLLQSSGWGNARLVRHDVPLRVAGADDLATAAEIVTWMGPLARRLAPCRDDADLMAAVQRSIQAALRTHTDADGITLTASVWLVSADA